ncbi:hypothetical protein [uncultured Devosia sp.]|nr:hypothetical protein [uncultured Devosia sp.]
MASGPLNRKMDCPVKPGNDDVEMDRDFLTIVTTRLDRVVHLLSSSVG